MNEMHKRINNLKRRCAQKSLIEITRKNDEYPTTGYAVGISNQFVLIHILDNNIYLNGYSALRIKDIKLCKTLSDSKYFANKAIQLMKKKPLPQPKIILDDITSIIESVNKQYPLLAVHCEDIINDACNIGKVLKITNKTVMLKEIDTCAFWCENNSRFRLKDITRIDFGGAYEDALWMVSQKH